MEIGYGQLRANISYLKISFLDIVVCDDRRSIPPDNKPPRNSQQHNPCSSNFPQCLELSVHTFLCFYVCSIVGAVVIVAGFYGVIWAMSQEEEDGRNCASGELQSPSRKTPLLESHVYIN